MLEISDLAVSYGKHRALSGVSLSVKPSEIVVILGANGAGKSTLLKAIAGYFEYFAYFHLFYRTRNTCHRHLVSLPQQQYLCFYRFR